MKYDDSARSAHAHSSSARSLQAPELLASSKGLGWAGVAAHRYLEPATAEQWTADNTADLRLILLARGTMDLEQRLPASAWNPFTVDQGELFLRPPGQERYDLRWTARSPEPIETVHIHVTADVVRRIATEMGTDPSQIEVVEQIGVQDPLLSQLALSLADGLTQPTPADPFYAQSAGQLLVAHLMRHYTVGRRPRADTPQGLTAGHVQRVREFVHAHLHQELSVETLAQQTGYSPYHFTRLFRHATGQSPYQFVLQQRVTHARHLLETSDLPVSAVASACGFASQSHLTHVFQRRLGATPRATRLAAENAAARLPLARA
ncbi:MAG: helix-turn-helix transcriptional regulator [Chloroflexales bacterium]|nr:helix-turn-helix transcriptional regulator [Chloroflexales bacterium]